MIVSLLFGSLCYWNYTNLDNSSSGWDIFLKFLGDILGTLIHNFQIILIFFISVSLLVGYFLTEIRNMRLSPLLYEIYFQNFLETLMGYLHTNSNHSEFLGCLVVSFWDLWSCFWNKTNMGLSPLLDEIYFQKILETLLGCLHTNSK